SSIARGSSAVHSFVSIQLLYDDRYASGRVILAVTPTAVTIAWSCATPAKYSCLYESPDRGSASMMIPGWAPLTPAIHPPSPGVQFPAPWQMNVSSPMYQTFPALS